MHAHMAPRKGKVYTAFSRLDDLLMSRKGSLTTSRTELLRDGNGHMPHASRMGLLLPLGARVTRALCIPPARACDDHDARERKEEEEEQTDEDRLGQGRHR